MSPYEVLEHTADVGLFARADTPEALFRDAAIGMLEIAGSWHPGEGRTVPVAVEAPDAAGLLVDWLSEVLYVQDAGGVSVGDVVLDSVTANAAQGSVMIRPFAGDHTEGVQIKAVTFHQLSVVRGADGWTARVFFDV